MRCGRHSNIITLILIIAVFGSCAKSTSREWVSEKYDLRQTGYYPISPGKPQDISNLTIKNITIPGAAALFAPYILSEGGIYHHIVSSFQCVQIETAKSNYQIQNRSTISARKIQDRIYILCEDHCKGIEICNSKGELIKRLETGPLDVKKGELLEINGEIKAILAMGSQYMPKSNEDRQLRMYDLSSGKLEWSQNVASNPMHLYIYDVNQDGEEEILLSTHSVTNSVLKDGFSDFCTSVFCFSNSGQLYWDISIPKVFSESMARMHNTGKVIVLNRDTYFRKWSRLTIVEPLTGEIIRQKEFSFSMSNDMLLYDTDGDGIEEILLGTMDNEFMIFDINLNIIKRKKFKRAVTGKVTESTLKIYVVNDLNTDGYAEYLCVLSDSVLKAKDPCLNEVAQRKIRLMILNDDLEIIREMDLDRLPGYVLVTDIFSPGSNQIWIY
ncbi:hypothetical protein KAU32_12650 [bacterium]|nr:hypothetical protein [bacterium]